MVVDRPDMPPVRLLPEAELARLAMSVPLLQQAVRLARWAAPRLAVSAAGELGEEQLERAAAELGLAQDPDAAVVAADAWAFALDTGLVEIAEDGTEEEPSAAAAVPGPALEQLVGGSPREVLGVWSQGLEAALADAAIAGLADPVADRYQSGPEDEAAFLEGSLAGLYLLAALEELDAQAAGRGGTAAVPLPVLAASMVLPDEMQVPTDAVLEEVSEVMMRLDAHFRFLAPTGLLEYQPVDDALVEEEDGQAEGRPDGGSGAEAGRTGSEVGDEELSRYGLVRLTPLGVAAVRQRLLRDGVRAPAIGDLAEREAAAVLDAVVSYPQPAGSAEAGQWLAGRAPAAAARELLAAARGTGPAAPARRLACQQMLSRLGAEAEPALREVLGDRELGGLARVWLAERGVPDVPAPDEDMVFWLTVDTIAAQLDVDDDPEMLQDLVRDLVARHTGFFDEVWRVDHPATAEVLEAMGRLHPDRRTAKLARKAAFKARSAAR